MARKSDARVTAALAAGLGFGLCASVLCAEDSRYRVTPLVSDQSVPNTHMDSNLVNAWGIAFNPMGFVWVANNHTGTATLYDGNGTPQTLVVSIPSPDPSTPGAPTGIVYSGGSDFVITNGTASGPARFIFATEDGTIVGWAPSVAMNNAFIVPGIGGGDAIYKGLAIASTSAGSRLYATDFHNAKVDVFNGQFQPVNKSGAFTDPTLPPRYAPFGIQTIGDKVYVTYALQDADREDEVDGPGLGFVDVYDTAGRRLARVASHGTLNAPWGVALAPSNFGEHSNDLLIGNFGDGRISTFSIDERRHGHGLPPRLDYRFDGLLRGRNGPIRIDGLWGMQFGNNLNSQPSNTLFFAAGPDDESHGLYGRIDLDRRH